MLQSHFCHGLRKLRCVRTRQFCSAWMEAARPEQAKGSGVSAGWYESAVVKRMQLTILLAFGFSGSS